MSENTSQLYFTDTKEGEQAIVFLHYFGGSEKTWVPVIEDLKTDYRCIAIDLLGFGSSPAPEKEISVADSTNKVLDVLQQLQLKQFVLIGHSMGGKIALAVAAKQPADLQQLILVAPSPPVPEPMTEDKRKELLATYGNREALEKLVNHIAAHPFAKELFESVIQDHLRISKNGWDSWLNKGSTEDITKNMKLINLPVHVVHGSKDPNFTMDFLKETFDQYFKKTSYTELPDVGHLVPLEAANELSKIIRSRLS